MIKNLRTKLNYYQLITAFCQILATLFESTGVYLLLAEHFKDYSKKDRLRLLKEIEI